MTGFRACLEEGRAKIIPADHLRARSMLKSSEQAIATAKSIPLAEGSLKTIFRELYEGLREYCEAIGYLKGYKFLDHLSITSFLKDALKEESISERFDRCRKLRIGINYYGSDINAETVKTALIEVPAIISELRKYTKLK